MQSEGHRCLADVAAGGQVGVRRKTTLGTGQIEADHPVIAHTDGQTGYLQGIVPVAHGNDDQTGSDSSFSLAAPETGQSSFHHLLDRDLIGGQEGRSEPNLGVYDPVGGQIQRRLEADALDGLRGAHHRDRVPEGLKVSFERPGLALIEPVGESFRIIGRQVLVAGFPGQFDDGLHPQPTIEMVVENDLGKSREVRQTVHRTGIRSRFPGNHQRRSIIRSPNRVTAMVSPGTNPFAS